MSPTSRALPAALATCVAAGLALTAAGPATAHDGEHHEPTARGAHSRAGIGHDLATMRRELSPFKDVDVALAAGYVPAGHCEVSESGGMGVHYANPALVGGLDPSQPAVLLYEPTEDGGMKLLGAEWFVMDDDQDLTTDDDRPSLLGRPFDGPMAGHGPGMPVHYDLHVWLYEANPAGIFGAWNPRVTC